MGSLWSLEGFGGPGAIWVLDAPGLSPLGWGFREDLGIQGEFRPNSLGALPVLELLKAAIGKAGYMDKVVIGMHMAASEFCHEGKYDMDFKSPPGSQALHHRRAAGAALPELHQGLPW